MNERPEQSGTGELLEVRARFGEPPSDAPDLTDLEAMPDERVQRDPARDDISARLLPGKVDGVEYFPLDQRQLVAATRPAERSAAVVVAIALEPTAGDRGHPVDTGKRARRVRRDENRNDRADTTILTVRLINRQPDVEPREQPSLLDRSSAAERIARVVQRPRGRAEHHDRVVAILGSNARQPMTGPVELARVCDRNQAEVSLRKPLPEKEERLVVRLGQSGAKDHLQALPKLGLERRHRTQPMLAAVIGVCVAGITGWTGGAVATAVREAHDLELVAGVSRSDPDSYGSVAEALDAVSADVLVDYTHASVVRANVLAALERGVNVVIGSSGLAASDYETIDRTARERQVGVISAGNFSLTAAVLLRAAADAARHLEAWEIVDLASAGKTDAPSGTARELAERLGEVRRPTVGVAGDDTVGATEAGGATVAGSQVHSIRLPSFSVSTEIVFAADGERLSIRHDAGASPAPYVAGTLLAIRSVVGRTGLTRGLDRLLQ